MPRTCIKCTVMLIRHMDGHFCIMIMKEVVGVENPYGKKRGIAL